MPDIDYGDSRIVVPAGRATPPQIDYGDARIVVPAGSAGRSLNIDMRGAPGSVRAAVGGAPAADRLATLQAYYPDARPLGDDNFVFTDPQTGQQTIYNPRGLDVGDLFSLRPEAAEIAGGVIGGLLAARGGPKASAATAATGATIGRELENLYATQVEGRVDTRSGGRQAADAATTFGVNAAGSYVPQLAVQGLKRVLGGGGGQALDALGAFERQGVTPRAGAVSGSGVVQSAEAAAGSFGGAGVMKDAYTQTIDEVTQAARRAATNVGTPMESQGIAGTVREGLLEAGKRFRARQEQLYDDVYKFFAKQTPVRADSTFKFLNDEAAVFASTPELGAKYGKDVADTLSRFNADAKGGELPFEVLRKVRSVIGEKLGNPVLVGDESRALLKRLYASLSDDLDSGIANNAGQAAQKAYEKANRYTRMHMTQQMDWVESLATQEVDKKVVSMLQGELGKDGGQLLRKLRYNLTPDQFDDVVASVVNRAGVDPSTGSFSPARFTTEWGKMSSEAKGALFGGQRYNELRQSLDDIAKIAGALEDSGRMLNRSNTSRALLYNGLLGGGGFIAGGLDGAVTAAVTGAVGFSGSFLAAKLLAKPEFAKWLATGMKIGGGQEALSAHLGRLSSVAAIEPQLKDAIDQYEAAVRSAMPQRQR
jgi:hypothetical protein